jgi:hypothetical protein
MFTLLISRCKNEINVKEWIKYHLSLGIKYIIIYDDHSDIPLNTYINIPNVFICTNNIRVNPNFVFSHNKKNNSYTIIFNKIKTLNINIDYIIDLDIDEYLYLSNFNNIIDFINFYIPFNQLSLNFLFMGNENKLTITNNSCILNFKRSAKKFTPWGKSIAKYNNI